MNELKANCDEAIMQQDSGGEEKKKKKKKKHLSCKYIRIL